MLSPRQLRRTPAGARALVAGALVAGALAAACTRAGRSRGAVPAAAQRLVGVWDATFVLDAPPLAFDSAALRRAPGGRVQGTLAFVPNHWLTEAAGLPAAPSVYGTYDVDFTPFGFDSRADGAVPEAVATSAAPRAGAARERAGVDSVAVVLSPAGQPTRVALGGVWHADSVVGTWRLESAPRAAATASGRFTLVPRRDARARGGEHRG